MHDQFDVTLEDQDLLGEVELTTNLIIAASETDEHLTTDEIDQILGVVPPRSAGLTESRRTAAPSYPRGVPCRHGDHEHGYISRKDDYLKRLRRIEGQARGLQRMVEEEKYCIESSPRSGDDEGARGRLETGRSRSTSGTPSTQADHRGRPWSRQATRSPEPSCAVDRVLPSCAP